MTEPSSRDILRAAAAEEGGITWRQQRALAGLDLAHGLTTLAGQRQTMGNPEWNEAVEQVVKTYHADRLRAMERAGEQSGE